MEGKIHIGVFIFRGSVGFMCYVVMVLLIGYFTEVVNFVFGVLEMMGEG